MNDFFSLGTVKSAPFHVVVTSMNTFLRLVGFIESLLEKKKKRRKDVVLGGKPDVESGSL